MLWLRIIVAVLFSALVLYSVGSIAWTLSRPIENSAPNTSPPPNAVGLNASDAAALAQPFADVVAQRDEALVARMAQGTDLTQARDQIDYLQGLLPNAPLQSSRLVTWTFYTGTDGQRLSGVHEHTFPDHVVRTETTLVRSVASDPWRVANFSFNVATKQALSANAFTLNGKPPLALAIIAAAAINPLFILATFLVALLWKDIKRRWVWLISTPFGIGTFVLNTVTGVWTFNPLSFDLFGASATWSGSAFDAWVIAVALPLGAIAFWATRPFSGRAAAPNDGEAPAS